MKFKNLDEILKETTLTEEEIKEDWDNLYYKGIFCIGKKCMYYQSLFSVTIIPWCFIVHMEYRPINKTKSRSKTRHGYTVSKYTYSKYTIERFELITDKTQYLKEISSDAKAAMKKAFEQRHVDKAREKWNMPSKKETE